MTKKLSIGLAVASGFLLTTTVFIGLPTIIYDANPGEFSSPLLNVIGFYLPSAAIILTLLIVPALLLPAKVARVWAALVSVIALYLWAHGVFQTHNFGTIDGQNFSVSVPTWQILAEALVIAVGIVAIFILAMRFQKMVAIFAVVLSAGLILQSWPALSTSTWLAVSDEIQMPKVSEFSSKGNALVVLMDTMASDVFEEVVARDPTLAKSLDGFIFYPDTVGTSPTTLLAMPTIHSGQVYRGGVSTSQFFTDAVKNHSVLTKVANAGYRSILVTPIQNICPNHVECLKVDAAMRSKKSVVGSEAIGILDAVLFRLAPLGLKNATYNDGEWVLRNWLEDQRFIQTSVQHNFFLQELAASMTVSSDRPTLKFLHLMNTHPPYVFSQECDYAGRQLDRSRENFTVQVRCSLERFAQLLNALKSHGIYDQTAIVLLADHGNFAMESARTEFRGAPAKLVGAANPTFAIKPVGSRGPMRTAGGEIYIGDFGATLCDLLKVCSVDIGISALKEPYGRTRVFNYYRWKHEFWKAKDLPGLTPYEIEGPIGRRENWIKDAPVQVGRNIDFSEKGTSQMYVWAGWSQPEAWGTWSDGSVATLMMHPDKKVPSRLTLQVTGFVDPGPVRAAVVINQKNVGEIALNKAKPAGQFTFKIPDEALEDGFIKLDLLIADPKSPKELGLSGDDRKVGIGLVSLRIDPEEP